MSPFTARIKSKIFVNFNTFLIFVCYSFQSECFSISRSTCVDKFPYRDGSHGLDLSYVTHIFLMDTILDISLMQQVISRAYRMGCKQSVVVNQLIMSGTIEESIYR